MGSLKQPAGNLPITVTLLKLPRAATCIGSSADCLATPDGPPSKSQPASRQMLCAGEQWAASEDHEQGAASSHAGLQPSRQQSVHRVGFVAPLAAHDLNDASCCASVWFETSRLACRANWTAKEGAQLIENLYLGKVLGAGMQIRPPVASCLLSLQVQWMQLHRYMRGICMCVHGMHVDSCASMAEAVCGSHTALLTNACKLDAEAVP